MKKIMILFLMGALFTMVSHDAAAQIKIDLKGKIKSEVNKRAEKKTKEGVTKGLDKMEEGVKGILGNEQAAKDSVGAGQDVSRNQATENAPGATAQAEENKPALAWSKYDFVPGDKIIFEDNLLNEENGEFPSRWDLDQGTVENAEFGGDKIIMFRGGSPTIVPYLKNSNIDYLPDVFTVEFDLYLPSNSFTVYFFDRKNQQFPRGAAELSVRTDKMDMSPASSMLPGGKSIANKWAHISIAYTSGKMKAYIDDTRLINIPHLEFNPTGISFHVYHASDNNRSYIKNIRIAEGGVKYYDRFLQDGKIISNGIRFDVGKASLRPESMGVINEIYKMLSEHPDVAVSVEGHTDSDGDNDLNQKLSEDRAKTVMDQLVSMGLSKERLSYRGYGESKPVAPNDTPEGKASNRRVEFVRNSGSNTNNSSVAMISKSGGDQPSPVKPANFQSVKIGDQVWMQKNLDVATFRNGDTIPQAKSAEEWRNMRYEKRPGWCYYNFSGSGEGVSSKLYNWFAVTDPRGLAPEGWRIPTDNDWDILRKKLAIGVAGKEMKSTTGWEGSNGTNASGFNGMPGGYCDYNGNFFSLKTESYWWGSDDDGSSWSPAIFLAGEDNYMHKHHMSKGSGLFVRCIQ
ncbi:MAG: FISUMP domain-containing protein [Bacteroidales bacterium]